MGQAATVAGAVASQQQQPLRPEFIRRFVLVALVFLIPIRLTLSPKLINDPDIWWHLQTGAWVAQNHAVPITDPFSASHHTWIAYSWLFDVAVYECHRAFGLLGIIWYQLALALLITLALFRMMRRWQPNIVVAVALTVLGTVTLAPMFLVRPWTFTVLFFILLMDLLWTARMTGNLRRLWWLPLLFALWANIHVQFVYGLFALGVAALEPAILRAIARYRGQGGLGAGPWYGVGAYWWVLGVSFAATFVSPYHWRIYWVIHNLMSHTAVYEVIDEFRPLSFRSPSHYLVLLQLIAAIFLLGWRREVRPFPMLLLLTSAIVSLRSARDMWFVAIVALCIIAERPWGSAVQGRFRLSKLQVACVCVVTILVAWGTARIRGVSNHGLEAVVEANFPVQAVDFVRRQGYSGPMFNHLNWGGYLIWSLPGIPISIDGRNNPLYDDKQILRNIGTWSGIANWDQDPQLKRARLIIADQDQPLTALLKFDHRFRLVYEDRVAEVFVSDE